VSDKRVRIGNKTVIIKETLLDRAMAHFTPGLYVRRLRSRMIGAIVGSYTGASRTRRTISEWMPKDGDPDSATIQDLPELRKRSRDLVKNAPLATGAINTCCTNIVGSGLKLHSQIDRKTLSSFGEDQAEAWEATTEAEWGLFWGTKDVDIQRTLVGDAICDMVLRQTLENGDVFVNLPRLDRGGPYALKIQLIESDRVCNDGNKPDVQNLIAGVQKDIYGAPTAYHVCNQFPVGYGYVRPTTGKKWDVIPAYGRNTGLPNILHIFRPLRPGQTRGIPYLSPVIEALKQLDRYSEAELMAAVVSAMFTVFIKTENGESGFDISELGAETNAQADDKDVKLASGAIVDLARGEEIQVADPKRPNAAFDPFVLAILRQIGVALEIPFEILIKHFTASYSAARAALLEAWKFFSARRQWLAQNFIQQVYEVWLYEAVTSGRINAPGFLTDPLIRKAYCGAEWTGPSKGMIDEEKEVNAAKERIAIGISNRQREMASLLGADWEAEFPQLVKENRMMKEAGLIMEPQQRPPGSQGKGGSLETLVDSQ